MQANRPYFKDLAADDVAGFYDQFRRMLIEVCEADIAPDPVGAKTLIAAVQQTVDVALGLEARLGLTLLADLNSNGALDKLLFGRGTILGKVQPYILEIEDLSAIDPSCKVTSFLRYRKGNPWFALPHDEICNDSCTVHTIERRVRRKQVELSLAGTTGLPSLRAFLFQFLAEKDLGRSVIITGCPLDDDAFFDLATREFGPPLDLENTQFFEGENTFVTAKFMAGFRAVTIWLPNGDAPHAISDEMCKMLEFTPSALHPVPPPS